MTQSRVAIVTGGAQGIGAGVALRLAADGHTVAVLDLSEESTNETVAAIREAGGSAVGIGADVGDADSVEAAYARIVEEAGPPTIVVNNAGIIRDNVLAKMSLDDWDSVMAVHLRGSFLMSKAALPFMREANFGRIVNLSSTSALGNRGQANYSAAKAGVQGFTKTLAIELGRYGITVNAIAPGFIQTAMTAATAARIGMDFEELIKQASAAIPVQRVGQPEDIANAVSFFTGEAAGFVSGQVLYVSGGPQG